jgi:hypothetical protein
MAYKKRREDETKRNFWQFHIDAHQKTNMCRKSYCREQNINYDRFLYWCRKQGLSSPAKVIPVKLKEVTPTASYSVLGTLKLNTRVSLLIHDVSVLTFLLERFA